MATALGWGHVPLSIFFVAHLTTKAMIQPNDIRTRCFCSSWLHLLSSIKIKIESLEWVWNWCSNNQFFPYPNPRLAICAFPGWVWGFLLLLSNSLGLIRWFPARLLSWVPREKETWNQMGLSCGQKNPVWVKSLLACHNFLCGSTPHQKLNLLSPLLASAST